MIGLGTLVSLILVAGPRSWASAEGIDHAPVRQPIAAILIGGIRDVNGNRLNLSSDPATPLYKTAAPGTPLLAPDGHQLTWGEWLQTGLTNTSIASVKCINKGTHIVIEATDLIPKALYTAWLFTQPTPGSPVFVGAVPSLVSGNNSFHTDSTGAGSFNAIAPAGPLSISGEIHDCLLENKIFILRLAYHSDGQLYGGVPGPPQVTIDHVNFLFQQ
jgi:hypothetical protein